MTSKYKKAAVIGHPISHSLSPRLHGYWLRQYNIDGSYEAIDVAPDDLAGWLKALPQNGFAGCNVTIPHKEQAAKAMDELSPIAAYLGAVNTVVVQEDGTLYGDNTDIYGFDENIKNHCNDKGDDSQEHLKHALVLGAGGAARAAILGLEAMGVSNLSISNRTQEKAEAMAKKYNMKVMQWGEWDLSDVTCLVNTTSLGMKGQPELDIDLSAMQEGGVVNDIVYNPLHTNLLKQAETKKLRVVTGIGMLLHQAVPGFEAWFGLRPDVTKELEAYVLEGLL